jgi:hypothetical protein
MVSIKKYKYNYVYLIENRNPTTEMKFYIGVRSCDVLPPQDKYMGSSSCKVFKKEFLSTPENFIKYILLNFDTRCEADYAEKVIHAEIDVSKDPTYYNRINSSCGGFKPVGMHTYKNSSGDLIYTHTKDLRVLSGELKSFVYGTISVYDSIESKYIRVNITDKLEHQITTSSIHMKGKTSFKDLETGENFILRVNDPRVLSGEYVGVNKNYSTFKNVITGETIQLHYLDDRVISGEYVGITSGKSVYKSKIDGSIQSLFTNDTRVLSGEFENVQYGIGSYKNKDTGEIIKATKLDPRVLSGEYVGLRTGDSGTKNLRRYICKITNLIIRTTNDDPRIKEGLLIKVKNKPSNQSKNHPS